MPFSRVSVVVGAFVVAACGRSALEGPADAGRTPPRAGDGGVVAMRDAGESPDAGFPPVPLDGGPACSSCPCPGAGVACGLVPIVDPSALCDSPWPDRDAELLALEASGAFVASAGLYARVHRDLVAIRAGWPTVSDIHAPATFDSGLLIVGDVRTLLAAPEFACFMRTYRGRVEYIYQSALNGLSVHFDPEVDPRQLIRQVEQFAGVDYAEPNQVLTDESDHPDLCLSLSGEIATYIFHNTQGNVGFTTEADGGVTALGTWSSGLEPAWYAAATDCTRNL